MVPEFEGTLTFLGNTGKSPTSKEKLVKELFAHSLNNLFDHANYPHISQWFCSNPTTGLSQNRGPVPMAIPRTEATYFL